MDKSTAQRTVSQTFKAAFDRDRFRNFVNELTNGFDETKKQTMQIPDAFKPHVASCQRISKECGARNLERVMDRLIGTVVAEALLGGKITVGQTLHLAAVDSRIQFVRVSRFEFL